MANYPTTKAERHRIKMLKFKKRQKNLNLPDDAYSFRSHGKPCSCGICKNTKYKRKPPSLKPKGV